MIWITGFPIDLAKLDQVKLTKIATNQMLEADFLFNPDH
jgi:hypothetical protein